MSYQLLAWLLGGSFLACCGCVAAVLGERRRAARLASLTDGMSRGLHDQTQTHVKLEERVQELKANLAKTEADCRRVLAANEQLTKESEARTAALRSTETTARTQSAALARANKERDELAARVSEQSEQLERDGARIATFETELARKTEAIETLTRRIDELEHDSARELSEERERAQSDLEAARSARAGALEANVRRTRELELDVERRADELRERTQRENGLSARIGDLEREISRRDESLLECTAVIESLRGEISAKRCEFDALALRCEALEQHLEQQFESEQRQVRELEERLESREGELRAWGETVVSLKVDLAARDLAVANGSRRCNELEQQLRQQLDGEQRQLRELEDRVESRDAHLRAHVAALESLQSELAARDQSVADSSRRCEELEQQLDGEQRQLRELEGRLESRDAQLQAHVATLESLHAELAARDQSVADSSRRCDELEQQLDFRQRQMRELEDCVESRDAQLLAHVATLESLQSELSARDRSLTDDRRDAHERELQLREQLDSEQRQVRELEERLGSRETQLRSQTETLESMQTDLIARERSVADFGRRCDDLERQLREQSDDAHHRISALEQSLAARVLELRMQSAAADSLRVELRARERSIDDLERSCRGFEQHVLDLKAGFAQNQEQLAQRIAANESLERELSDWRGQHEALVQHSAELARRLENECESTRAAQQAARDMECRLAERIGDLEANLERRGSELRERSAAVEALERALVEVNARDATLDEQNSSLHARSDALAQELDATSSRCAALAEQCEVISTTFEMRGLQLLERDHQIRDSVARAHELKLELERDRAASAADRDLMDEFVNGRLSTLFRRRADQVVATLAEPYAAGISRNDLALALRGMLGDPSPLSPASFARLSERWRDECQAWKTQSIERKVAYLWADGVRVKQQAADNDPSLLIVLAGFVDGTRAVLAIESGDRASADVWRDALRRLVDRGMNVPKLVVADADLGIWAAIAERGWDCAQQYCWDHEIERAIKELPKCRRRRAGELLQEISEAETRSGAAKLRDLFLKRYCVHRPAAGERLRSSWESMNRFMSFPKEHWHHLRTASVVGSPLASMRLSTLAPKAWEQLANAEAILWKLIVVSEQNLRPLDSSELLPSVAAGEHYVDGVHRRRSAAA